MYIIEGEKPLNMQIEEVTIGGFYEKNSDFGGSYFSNYGQQQC